LNKTTIKLVYDKFVDGEPVANGRMREDNQKNKDKSAHFLYKYECTNLYMFECTNKIEFAHYHINSISTDDTELYYYIIVSNLPYLEFSFSKNTLNQIQKNSNIIVIYFCPNEAWLTDPPFQYVSKTLDQFHIPRERKFYITGDSGVAHYTHQNDFYILPLNIWQFHTFNHKKLPKIIPQNVDLSHYRAKHFLYLNGRDKPHRRALYKALFDRRIINKCYASYVLRNGLQNPESGYEFCDTSSQRNSHFNFWATFESQYLDVDKDTLANNDRFLDLKYVYNTYINIVTESWFNDVHPHYNFLTEKTFKPILWCQPFIILGNSGSLRQLRKLGFKTFSDFIDESYDEIPDSKERMQAVINEIHRLSTLPLSVLHEKYNALFPVIRHNFGLMYNYNYSEEVKQMFSEIKKLQKQNK
jgi:hypothetical protein